MRDIVNERKKNRERQDRRRQAMRDAKCPETHTVDRALSEALAYVAVLNHPVGTPRKEVMVPLRDVLKTAARILAHRGRFDMEASIRAVVKRTRERSTMNWTLPAPTRPERGDRA